MKKLILLILVGSLLLLTVTSCLQNNKNEQTTPQTTPDETTPDETTTNAIELNPAPTIPIPTGVLDKNNELIVELLAYLRKQSMVVVTETISVPLADKISSIKNGARPIHVAFNPNNYYFVCGYFNLADGHNENLYCCREEYTWIGYKSEAEIQEYLSDMKCIVVFQINKALTVTDIFDTEANTLNMEHFQIYKPSFENGVNIKSAVVFEETFIYLDNPNKDTVYYSTSSSNHKNKTIPCAFIDWQYYISVYLYEIDASGNPNKEGGLTNEYFKYEFGEYYDAIVSVMDIDRYNVIGGNGRTAIYGVISLGHFFYGIVTNLQ